MLPMFKITNLFPEKLQRPTGAGRYAERKLGCGANRVGRLFPILLAVLVSTPAAWADYKPAVDLDRESGLYEVGETATFTVSFPPGDQIAPGAKIRYIMKLGAKPLKTETFEADGQSKSFQFTAEQPCWVYFGLEVLDDTGKPRTDIFRHGAKKTIVNEIGAVFSPEKIVAKPSMPDDFDAYWAGFRAKLDEMPAKATLTPVEVPKASRDKVECFAVVVDCYGAHPVTGYLAIPRDAKAKSLPAKVDFLSLAWVDANRNTAIQTAANGALALYVTWHGAPTGLTEADYKKDPVIGSKAYGRFVVDDRDRWFFRDTYIRTMRALDYIKSRPEWNGRDLIVQGGSLGGSQAAVAAALDPAVTLAIVGVPSQSEFNAFDSDRMPSIPFRGRADLRKRLRDEPAVAKAAAYFDLVNFAPKIRCEVYVSTGFTDETCYPDNVFAFYNAIPESTKKAMTTNPRTGHFGTTRNVKGDARLKAFFREITVH